MAGEHAKGRSSSSAKLLTAYARPGVRRKPGKHKGAQESRTVVSILLGVAEAMKIAVNRYTEIVVHDLTNPESSIVFIVNGHVSRRQVGQSALAGPLNDRGLEALLSPSKPYAVNVLSGYRTVTRDGRALESSSVIYFDSDGRPEASLCVNIDREAQQIIQKDVGSLLTPAEVVEPKADGLAVALTMDKLTMEIVQQAIESSGVPVSRMRKDEKLAAVSMMHRRGLFLIRGSVEMVAERLTTSKFTIYNYLDQIGAGTRKG